MMWQTSSMALTKVQAELRQSARQAVYKADFRDQWPTSVLKTLVKAGTHEGDWPPYAEEATRRALRTARAIEARMARQIDQGTATLSQADRKRLAVR